MARPGGVKSFDASGGGPGAGSRWRGQDRKNALRLSAADGDRAPLTPRRRWRAYPCACGAEAELSPPSGRRWNLRTRCRRASAVVAIAVAAAVALRAARGSIRAAVDVVDGDGAAGRGEGNVGAIDEERRWIIERSADVLVELLRGDDEIEEDVAADAAVAEPEFELEDGGVAGLRGDLRVEVGVAACSAGPLRRPRCSAPVPAGNRRWLGSAPRRC